MTVIIVDDDEGFRRAARELLEGMGLRVVAEVADGAAARAACAARRPAGVLLDVTLPDIAGHALARELRAAYPGLRILLTSSDDTIGGEAGVADFVPKIDLAVSDLAGYFRG
ncbi:response regulator [Solirubrobacter soli]|uniref:response regulator n=1 Tax=Solirubrobacter soli TaxID=363832 RepID=UPI00040CB98D|nr:response regulator [Solirubrobacter soli]